MNRSSLPRPAHPLSRDVWALPFALVLALMMAIRGLLHGASMGEAATFLFFLAAYTALPGWLAYQRFRAPDDDWIMALGMGWTLGYVIQLAVYLGLKLVGAPWLYPFFPVLLLPLVPLALHYRPRGAVPASPPLLPVGLLLLLLLVAVERTPLVPHWWLAGDTDLGFHVGSAAELKIHWPLRDPRVAGEPLNYHFFSHAFPAAASQVSGIPVGVLLFRLAAPALPLLLTIQVFNAGRLYSRSVAAGLLASALVVLHADIGIPLLELLSRPGSNGFRSYLALGIYTSISTVLGLVLFTSLAIVLRRWLVGPTRDHRALGLAVVLAAAVSGAKGAVMPVVLAALAALVGWTWLVRRRRAERAFAAAVLLALAAAPMTLYLTVGRGSYASAMFGFEPLRAMLDSDAYLTLDAWIGVETGWLPPLAVPLWLLGFLGVAGVTGLLFLWRERRCLDDARQWLAWTFVAGLVPALLLAASGMSQVFFLYNGQVALAVFGGAGLASQGVPRTLRAVVLTLLLSLLALPMLLGAGRDTAGQLARDWSSRPPASDIQAAYDQGLRWIREGTSPDALFLTNHGFILISAFGERRVFYETDRFAAAALAYRSARRWGPPSRIRDSPMHPFGPRVRALRRFLERPDHESARVLRAFARQKGEMYLVVDSIAKRIGRGWGVYEIRELGAPDPYESTPLLVPVFNNRALRIYRVDDGSSSARGS